MNTFSTSAYCDANYKNWCDMQDKKMKITKYIVSIQNSETHGKHPQYRSRQNRFESLEVSLTFNLGKNV